MEIFKNLIRATLRPSTLYLSATLRQFHFISRQDLPSHSICYQIWVSWCLLHDFLFVSWLSRNSSIEFICMDSWRFSWATKTIKVTSTGINSGLGKQEQISGGRSIENGWCVNSDQSWFGIWFMRLRPQWTTDSSENSVSTSWQCSRCTIWTMDKLRDSLDEHRFNEWMILWRDYPLYFCDILLHVTRSCRPRLWRKTVYLCISSNHCDWLYLRWAWRPSSFRVQQL